MLLQIEWLTDYRLTMRVPKSAMLKGKSGPGQDMKIGVVGVPRGCARTATWGGVEDPLTKIWRSKPSEPI